MVESKRPNPPNKALKMSWGGGSQGGFGLVSPLGSQNHQHQLRKAGRLQYWWQPWWQSYAHHDHHPNAHEHDYYHDGWCWYNHDYNHDYKHDGLLVKGWDWHFLILSWWFFRLFIIFWVLVCWEFLLHSFLETLPNIILQARDIKILPKLSPCTWEFRFAVASSQDSSDQDYPDFL